jgi:PAS domain S-box-containing protein
MKLQKESVKRSEWKHGPAKQALRISELRYRRLFETAQDGILILNAESGRIDDANPFLAKMLGYSREQLLGNKLWDIVPIKDVEATKAEFRDLQRKCYVRYDDIPLETRDGRSINVEVVSNIYRVNGDRVVQCNIRDITERRQTEEKLQEYSRKLKVLSRRLVEAQETERRHLARELHDEIGQSLTSAQINLQTLLQSPDPESMGALVKESLDVVEHVLAQVDDISLNLRPTILDDLGLEPALRWFTERQVALVGLRAEFRADPLERRLDPVIETECFRVAQGALTNVVRHAKAKTVIVELRVEAGRLHLRVRDDGAGFDVTAVREQALRGATLGLLSMEERAALAGGGLEVKSAPEQGAKVHAWFPLKWKMPAAESKIR